MNSSEVKYKPILFKEVTDDTVIDSFLSDDVDIVTHLKAWGLEVFTEDGYRTRGGEIPFDPRGVMLHSGTAAGHIWVRTDGKVKVVANGFMEHTDFGGPLANIPKNQGDNHFYGVSTTNSDETEEQLQSLYRLSAALLDYLNISDVSQVIGHKEWSKGHDDPEGIVMNDFRRNVKKALTQGPSQPTVHIANLKLGKRNFDVYKVKKRLQAKGIAVFDLDSPAKLYWSKTTSTEYEKWQKETGIDANGIPGKDSLQKLGFRVLP